MKKGSPWGTIGTVVLVVVVVRLVRKGGPGISRSLEATGLPEWAIGVGVGIAVFVFFSLLFRWAFLQSAPPSWGFLPAHPQNYPQLDGLALNRYTEVLQSLGFVWVQDYTLDTSSMAVGQGFARLFLHPTHHCYAELGQVFPLNQRPLPLCCTFMSSLGDEWSYSSTNRKADAATYMLRRPRSLWTSLPEADAPALLKAHLAQQQQLAADLGVGVRSDLSWDAYWLAEQENAAARRRVIQRKNMVFGVLGMLLFALSPRSEWMGDYARIRARKGRSAGRTAA